MDNSVLDNPVFTEILNRYVNESEKAFRRQLQAEGVVLTGDLLNSIRAGAMERGKGFITASVHYDMLLRIKDLKQLNFSRMPPMSAMVAFVEKVGVGAFPYIPGYPSGITPRGYTATVERIADGLRYKLKKEPNVKRGYRGVYNEPLKNEILPRFFRDLREHAGMASLRDLGINFSK